MAVFETAITSWRQEAEKARQAVLAPGGGVGGTNCEGAYRPRV